MSIWNTCAWRRIGVALLLVGALASPLDAQPAKDDQSGRDDDYNQWKLSLGAGQATDPRTFTVAPGFQVELLRSAQPTEGSWIALTFDSRGRAIVSREDKGLWRFTWDESPNGEGPPRNIRLESINDTLLECRGLLWAYDSLYANANNSKGLYRLRDTDGDDRFDEVKLLRATTGGVGHGRNDLALGPDGSIYLIHGDDTRLPADFAPSASPLRRYEDARLFPCSWDSQLFNAAMVLPGGHLIRTDRDGQTWELVAGGLRNPYGIDFNADGQLFTFDADMEWDVGMPWYRPTRVLHLVSGADFGWRHGTGPWPAWYPDSLPSTLDVGLGSPTAVRFGTKTKFPRRWRDALFIADWSYGRILAVNLKEQGSSYAARSVPFLSGRPLNLTDLEVGPDGAIYFLTGGRKTQSGLYRIRYVGPRDEEEASGTHAEEPGRARNTNVSARRLRAELETFHRREDARAVELAWPSLATTDPWLRHAARLALERQSLDSWFERLASETNRRSLAVGLLAAARVAPVERSETLLDQFARYPWLAAAPDEQVIALRALALTLARLGRPNAERLATLRERLEPVYPSTSAEVNFVASELLAYVESPLVVSRTMALLRTARAQEEKLRYLYVLRVVAGPWTMSERRAYFEHLRQAREFYGAHYLPKFIDFIQQDAVALLTDAQRTELADVLAAPTPAAESSEPIVPRPHVRQWLFQDLVGSLDWKASERNLEQGRAMFAAALCSKCHRLEGTGTPVGPDLQNVGRRFGRRDLLLSILHPSQVIDEKYQMVRVTTTDGRVLTGQKSGGGDQPLTLIPNPLEPSKVVRLAPDEVEELTPSLVSPMPAGLLNSLTKSEILDLLAYLEQAGTRP